MGGGLKIQKGLHLKICQNYFNTQELKTNSSQVAAKNDHRGSYLRMMMKIYRTAIILMMMIYRTASQPQMGRPRRVSYFALKFGRRPQNAKEGFIWKYAKINNIPDICHEHHERCSCKFFLSGVNFSRMNKKYWLFPM
jgi:hypothetical protein